MPTLNLWGDLPDAANIRSPEQILKEQASELTRMTNGKIVGVVENFLSSDTGLFTYKFSIKSPPLNNYTTGLLTVTHRLGFYPASIVSQMHPSESTYDVATNNEIEFIKALADILTSAETRKVIASLLTHITSIQG